MRLAQFSIGAQADNELSLSLNHRKTNHMLLSEGRRKLRSVLSPVLPLIMVIAAVVLLVGGVLPRPSNGSSDHFPRISAKFSSLPVSFEPNRGQTDSRVKFLTHGPGYALFLASDGAALRLDQRVDSKTQTARRGRAGNANATVKTDASVLGVKLLGANPRPLIEGVEPQSGHVNYFVGDQPSKWRRDIPTYERVVYREVYPGIDQIYHGGNQDRLEYDFVVAPGADPKSIRMRFEGAEKLSVDRNGDLAIGLGDAKVILHSPVIYQKRDGHRETVGGKCVLADGNSIRFDVASYDHARPLVIDPGLVYSTYLGGSRLEQGTGIAVDAAGNAYLTGFSRSLNFPVTPGAFQPSLGGGVGVTNAFVRKLNPDGSGLVYSTYLGGSFFDEGNAIAVDGSGDAFVTGLAESADFPVTTGAFQTQLGSGAGGNAFITKLNPDGSGLIYSTYLGGGLGEGLVDFGMGIAVDSSGDAFVTGQASSSDFPVTAGAFQPMLGSGAVGNAFVTKLKPDGSGLVYSSYLGGSNDDGGNSIATDSSGNAYVTGFAFSTDFPVTAGAFQTTPASTNDGDPFVTKVNSGGSGLVYSTFLGGSGSILGFGDVPLSIAVEVSVNAYVTGFAASPDFPVTAGAFQTTLAAGAIGNAFVTEMNPVGSGLEYSTYLGGSFFDEGAGIAIDGSGEAYLVGATQSANFPVTPQCLSEQS